MPIPKATTTGEMPFLDHLEELRWRIIYSLAALLVGVVIGFWLVLHFDLIRVLEGPIKPYLPAGGLVYTHPGDSFSILMQTAISVGIAIALPVILYQLWAFLSPALHSHEKKMVVPVLAAGTFLFLSGVAMCWFLVLPMTLQFFYGLGIHESLTALISVEEYFSFVTTMCLAFGGTFEVPIVLVGMIALGIMTPQKLASFRKFAVVICWAGAAIITPGDLFTTTLALAVPLYFLYEISVVAGYIIYRRKQRRLAAEAEEERRLQEEERRDEDSRREVRTLA